MYDKYYAGQKAYHDVVAAGLEPGPDLRLRIATAVESLIKLADELGVFEE